MTNSISARINQGFTFLFGNYNKKWDNEVKKILKTKELLIFHSMGRYDRIHSYNLYKKVKRNSLLKENQLYLKLALLHDCGKDNPGIFRRVKKVIIGDRSLANHTKKGYEKIVEIDRDLAELIKTHHDKTESLEMIEFQRLDNE